jgi:hypothetical protein
VTAFIYDKILTDIENTVKRDEQFDRQRLFALYDIVDKLIFELVANSRDLGNLEQIVNLLIRIMKLDSHTLMRVVNERIFPSADKLGKDDKTFVEIIVFHSEPEVRSSASKILQFVF